MWTNICNLQKLSSPLYDGYASDYVFMNFHFFFFLLEMYFGIYAYGFRLMDEITNCSNVEWPHWLLTIAVSDCTSIEADGYNYCYRQCLIQ